jgi:hypothetical protein
LRIACELSELALRLAPRRFPAGVHRYQSIAEASARRDRWERQPHVGTTLPEAE